MEDVFYFSLILHYSSIWQTKQLWLWFLDVAKHKGKCLCHICLICK